LSSSTAWRASFCPAGHERSPFLHCLRLLFCPAGERPLGACSPPLASRRDSCGRDPAARSGPGTPRCPQKTASPTPQPRAARRVPAASGAMAATTRRAESPRPPKRHSSHLSSRAMASGRVVVRTAPRATGAMSPERAGPERASRGGVSLAWSHTNSEGPRRGTSLLGRMRRRIGGLGSMPSPCDSSWPAGQERPHAVKEERKVRAATRPASTASSSARYSAQCR